MLSCSMANLLLVYFNWAIDIVYYDGHCFCYEGDPVLDRLG